MLGNNFLMAFSRGSFVDLLSQILNNNVKLDENLYEAFLTILTLRFEIVPEKYRGMHAC